MGFVTGLLPSGAWGNFGEPGRLNSGTLGMLTLLSANGSKINNGARYLRIRTSHLQLPGGKKFCSICHTSDSEIDTGLFEYGKTLEHGF